MTTSPVPMPLPVQMVPGIVYSPLARRARVEGSGLEVWEIVRVYRQLGDDFHRLAQSFDWLTQEQLRAALTCAELNPSFVDAKLAEANATARQLEGLWKEYPFTVPPHLR